jgi:hypothetical protein
MMYLRGEYLRIEDAARLLDYNAEHVTRMRGDGKIQGAIKSGGGLIIPLDVVFNYLGIASEKAINEYRQALYASGAMLVFYGNYCTEEETAEMLGVTRRHVIGLCRDKKFNSSAPIGRVFA